MAQIPSQIRLHVGSATLDPLARLAARLNSAWLANDVGPTMLTCILTGQWHADVIITSG